MKQLLLFLLTMLFCVQVNAADSMSSRMAQRVLMILDRAEANPEEALNSLKELVGSRPEDSRDRGYILYERAVLLLQYDQAELARQEIASALVGRSEDYMPRLRFLLGQLHLMANEPEAALEQLNIWLEYADSPRASEIVIVGYTNAQLERFDDAASALERALALAQIPQKQWFELLAFSYMRLGRNEEAIALLERIIAEEPSNARWWRQLGSIYLMLEDVPKGAAGIAISSVVADIEFDDAISLARLFNMLGMPADGAQVLETAFGANPDLVGFEEHMLLGELWVLAREFELAVREFEFAAGLDASGEANWKLGQMYLQRERYQEAAMALQNSIAGYGEQVPPQVYYLLAVVAINLEDFDSANTALGRIENDVDYARRAQQLNAYILQLLAQQD